MKKRIIILFVLLILTATLSNCWFWFPIPDHEDGGIWIRITGVSVNGKDITNRFPEIDDVRDDTQARNKKRIKRK